MGFIDVSADKRAIALKHIIDSAMYKYDHFKDVTREKTGIALKHVIDSAISKYHYETKLVSQSYDGAVVMAG